VKRWLAAGALLLAAACRTATPVAGMPRNFGVVEEGAIYRGAQPTSSEMESLQRRGVRTIVKLNTQELDRERADAARLGIQLIYLPLNARLVGTPGSCAEVERAYEAMTRRENQPVYVHCSHGRDRTGFLIGLWRERQQHWPYEKVKSELALYGHGAAMHAVLPNIENGLARGVCGR